ncbi:octopamine receptor beta-2R-like [Xenia sp. Carnegie-2017]|uniref:octopamine receptor beta-2R-like n=1 Tax=Xenia sp. Carnegie-2017 TaxID=2897299 RepID=UPI001F049897|nr:octopamine receptor beta-2R-like [Xenia sp. Carnegie-2017]
MGLDDIMGKTPGNITRNSTKDGLNFPMDNAAVLAAAVVEILIILVGLFGNSLTIIAVLRSRDLQYATNYLIVSLSVADLLVCTILVPMRASQHIAFQFDRTIPETFVKVAGFIGRVNILASISTLVCLSIDRYLALSRPLKYATSIKYNLSKVLMVIVTIWILSVIITSIPKFPGISDSPFLIFFVVFVLTATLLIVIMYYKIFQIIVKYTRKIGEPKRYSGTFQRSSKRKTRKEREDSGIVISINSSAESSNVNCNNERTAEVLEDKEDTIVSSSSSNDVTKVASNEEARTGIVPFSREERKAAQTVGFVIAAFILFVYPRIILILYHFAEEETNNSIIARFWMRVLLYANSAVNPTFYAYRHKGFRKEFRKMSLKCLGLGRLIRNRYPTYRET